MNKDWIGNSVSVFKQLGATSHTKEEREENDYYATDPKSIDDLLDRETFSYNIWECASGGGHMVERLRARGKNVLSTDIVDRGDQDFIEDFLKTKREFDGDIITNPPYKFATEFVLKALEKVREGGKVAMFLKLTFLEGQERYTKLFKENPPKTIYVYVKRIQCGKNGEFVGTSAVCYAWYVWKKGFRGKTSIDWIY